MVVGRVSSAGKVVEHADESERVVYGVGEEKTSMYGGFLPASVLLIFAFSSFA